MSNLNETATENLEKRAAKMLSWDDFVVEEYKKDPEWARHRVNSELDEYAKSGEIKYLLSTLKDVATAKGWMSLAQETGLSRQTLYQTLNGQRCPRVDTLIKILQALGFRMLFVPVDHRKTTAKATGKRASARKTKKQEKPLQHA